MGEKKFVRTMALLKENSNAQSEMGIQNRRMEKFEAPVDCRRQTLFSFLSQDERQTAQIVCCTPRNVQTFKLHCSYVHNIIRTTV